MKKFFAFCGELLEVGCLGLSVFIACYLVGCFVQTIARLLWFTWTSSL